MSTPLETAGAGTSRRFVIADLGVTRYGIEVERVLEVFPLPPCARVPRAPKWLRGALLRQGSLVAVVDLGAFFERADSAQPQVCILIDDPELHVALAVAAVKVVEGRDTVRASEVKDYLPDPDWITESLSTPQFDFHRLDIGRVLAGLGERL